MNEETEVGIELAVVFEGYAEDHIVWAYGRIDFYGTICKSG